MAIKLKPTLLPAQPEGYLHIKKQPKTLVATIIYYNYFTVNGNKAIVLALFIATVTFL